MDPAEFLFHRLEHVWRQDTGAKRSLVAVLARNIPSAKYKLLHVRQGDELVDQGKPRIGSLAQTNALHLGKGTKGLRQAFARQERARDKSGGHGAQPGKQDAEPPAGGLNLFSQLWIVGCLFAHVTISGDIIC